MRAIDLNADLGEGAANDAALLRLVTSANIACGGHAGDGATMRRTVELALAAGVAIGAHPGYGDRAHFGRVETGATPAEIAALVREQVGALQAVAGPLGARVTHVKPHGALYHRAARDTAAATAIAGAVAACGRELVLVGLAGGALLAAGRAAGLRVLEEAFADRRYEAGGRLVPRSELRATIADVAEAAAQAVALATRGVVRAADGTEVAVAAETLCVHGDGPEAVALARAIAAALAQAGVQVRSYLM